jgi:tRNA G46 methylase TrmB
VIIVAGIWDKVYSNDSAFFGEDPSDFAQKCYREFKQYHVKKILELGCGQGRDTIFFASNV